MSDRRRPDPADQSGFTLIEVLIVVLIVGLLGSIAIPVMGRAIDKAHRATVAESGRTLYTALVQYSADNGRFPIKMDTNTLAPLSTGSYLDNAESIVSRLQNDRLSVYIPLGTEEFFIVLRSRHEQTGVFTVMRTDNWGGDFGTWYDGVYWFDPTIKELVKVDEAT